MARVNFVKRARKDINGTDIKRGDSYYWWKFKFGKKQVSKIKPRDSQLTQSEFLGTIYEIQDRISELTINDDLDSEVQSIISDLESLRDECEEKRSNMPEQLQETGSGEILQNRYDSVDEMIDELQSVETDVDEEDVEQEIRDSNERDADDETEEDYEDRIRDLIDEEIESRKEDILSEIQNISYNGE
jgi:hypothetical protein